MAKLNLAKLREIGWSHWDSIGLKSMLDEGALCDDEYDTYLMRAAEMVIKGADDAQIVEYLVWVETDYMGLGFHGDERATATVRAIRTYAKTLNFN